MKDYRKFVYVLIGVSLVNLIAMLCLIPGLPESVPAHYNIRFEVDRMGSKWFVALFPAITLLFSVSIAVEQKIRGRDYANNKPLTIFATFFVALFIALGWVLYAMSGTGAQLGDVVNMPFDLVICLGLSVLFIVMGNYLPTVKQNKTYGIRMRATFESEEVWRKVHRFGGLAYVIGGLVSAVIVLIGYFSGAKLLEFVGLLLGMYGSTLAILIYAKRLEKKMKGGKG